MRIILQIAVHMVDDDDERHSNRRTNFKLHCVKMMQAKIGHRLTVFFFRCCMSEFLFNGKKKLIARQWRNRETNKQTK